MFTTRSSGLAVIARSVALTVALFTAASAHAVPITYLFKGVASGTYRTDTDPDTLRTFTREQLTVTILTDTDNIDETRFGPGRPATNALVQGSINLGSLGNGTFDSLLYVFNNQSTLQVGFGDLAHSDLINVINPGVGLNTYDLNTNFGPIAATSTFISQFDNVDITFGSNSATFDLISLNEATFEAITGPVAPIPEPETWALMALGLGLMAAYGSRRQKSAS